MKTYETWEVIKALSENPKLRFKDFGSEIFVDAQGCLSWKEGEKFALNIHGTNNNSGTLNKGNWQLVRTPVTWQEAIQAWSEDKGIECECKSCGGGHADSCKFNSRNDDYDFCKQGIKSGVWFILDGDADE